MKVLIIDIGGGNVSKLDMLPPGCRAGDNDLAFRGGFLLWEKKVGKAKTNRIEPRRTPRRRTRT